MVIIKILDTVELIEDACALLYTANVEYGDWEFSSNNPSQLRIEIRHNRHMLVDRFTDDAIWFGAFDESKLIGCTRLTFPDENNKLEMEGYKNSAVIQKYFPKDKSHCVESTRSRVLKSHSGLGIIWQLLLAAFQYCEDNRYSLCATTNNEPMIAILKKISFPLKLAQAFKYEERDPSPVNFYFADYSKLEIKNIILNLEIHRKDTTPKMPKIFEALKLVAPILPTILYWHNKKGTVLGLNTHCLDGMGKTRDAVVGKTPYDFYPKEVAENILKHNEQVIKTRKILSKDEEILDAVTGKIKIYRNTKTPLYNDEGEVIGLIGSAIDITTEKEAEGLKIENEKQKTLLEQEERFRKVANKVAHDIQSPLSSLTTIVKNCMDIPEPQRIALREAATNIKDIANYLLLQYEKKESGTHGPEERRAILVSMVLSEILSSKKYQYEKRPIQFNIHFNPNTQFAFIHIGQSAFKRMLSNLINNAVDACEDNPGTVKVTLMADNEWVKIVIIDSGKGMPQETRNKIMNKIAFTAGKQSGHGIGLTQVWETLEDNQGELDIDSTSGQGTTITLTFPRISAPNWIAEKIVLDQNDTVVILDDDSSIHGAWDTRFESILKQHATLQVKHFKQGSQALEFIQGLDNSDKEHVFLLSDYELINQNLNGLEVIEQAKVKHAILVTSHYANAKVQKEALEIGTRILPKELASEVNIQVLSTEEQNILRSRSKQVEIVIVDDNVAFTKTVLRHILWDKVADQYNSPEEFLKNVDRYTLNTRIYLDNNYDNSFLRGLDIAKKLHEKGFKKLYLLSGDVFESNETPDYLTVINKADIDSIREEF